MSPTGMRGQEAKDLEKGRLTCSVFFPRQDYNCEGFTGKDEEFRLQSRLTLNPGFPLPLFPAL